MLLKYNNIPTQLSADDIKKKIHGTTHGHQRGSMLQAHYGHTLP
jgi:hypothetical protein